jgi:beta-lactam-binding protein with PASTA domain
VNRTKPAAVALALLLSLSLGACEDATTGTSDVAVAVPDVVGMDYSLAKEELEAAGFTVMRVDRPGAGPLETVRSQKPRADTLAWPAGRITLVVVSSASPAPSPTSS